MIRYTAGEIWKFLDAIERNLSESVEIIIIGGTAAALAYNYSGATQDIDTANSVSRLAKAAEAARKETGLNIPVSMAAVFDPPYNYEDRLIEYETTYSKLKVKVPEVIDLILMKVCRCEEHDLQAIEYLVKAENVKLTTLVERFKDEMTQAIKRQSDLEFNLLVAIERAFGEKEAKLVRLQLKR